MRGDLAKFKRFMLSVDEVEFRGWWCPDWTRRRVTKRQSNSIALEHPHRPGVDSWLQWPEASEVSLSASGCFTIGDSGDWEGKYSIHYRPVQDRQDGEGGTDGPREAGGESVG